MGVYNTWYLVGIAGGSFLGGILADWLGFRNAMMLCAGLFAGGLGLTLLRGGRLGA